MDKVCATCEFRMTKILEYPCDECNGHSMWKSIYLAREDQANKTISFPILNNLTPTVESCTMKVLEEVGELMQLIGKGQGKSGEKNWLEFHDLAVATVKETLDVAQAAVTMAHTICKEHNLSLDVILEKHEKKLYERGYLK